MLRGSEQSSEFEEGGQRARVYGRFREVATSADRELRTRYDRIYRKRAYGKTLIGESRNISDLCRAINNPEARLARGLAGQLHDQLEPASPKLWRPMGISERLQMSAVFVPSRD